MTWKSTSLSLFASVLAVAVVTCTKVKTAEGGESDSTTTSAAAAEPTGTGSDSGSTQTPPPDPNAQQATAKSNISFELTEYNWGNKNQGDKVEYTFTFTNTGTETLKIFEAKPSCGCTVPSFDDNIEPGKTGEIRATVDTSRLTGNQHKTITVKTNSAAPPEVQLKLNGDVTPLITVTPQTVGFGQISVLNGEVIGDKKEIVVIQKGAALQGALEVSGVEIPEDAKAWLTAKVDSKPDGSYTITIDLLEKPAFDAAKAQTEQRITSNPESVPNPKNHSFTTRVNVTTNAGSTPTMINVSGSFLES
jgi:hypothetical protein